MADLVGLDGRAIGTVRQAGTLGPGRGGRLMFTETGRIDTSVGVWFELEPGPYLICSEADFERMVLDAATKLQAEPVS